MFDILDELLQTEEMYNNNLEQIEELEKKNIRLISEMRLSIKNTKNEIIKMINDNEDYLKLNPHISIILDDYLERISYDKINDISEVKIIIEILNEIREHKQNIANQQKRQMNNDNDEINMNSNGFFNKIVVAVKEELKNDN